MMKKLKTLLSVLCALVIGASFTACASGEASAQSVVTLDINPSIELIVDSEGVVINAYGTDEDGKILLFEEDGIEGEKVEQVVEKITDLAVELGYLNENNKVINTSVNSKDDTVAEELFNKIKTKITDKGNALGFSLTVDKETAFSMMRDYQAFIAEHPEFANITLDQFKLAVSASKTGEITVEAALELDKEELIKLIADARKEIKDYATKEFEEEKVEKLEEYQEKLDKALEDVYKDYFGAVNNIATNPQAMWYGHAYHAYKSFVRGLNALADVVEEIEEADEYALNETQVTAVMTALGITDKSLIEDDGKVTIESIEEYVDIIFKNSSEDLTEVKTALNNALNGIENDLAVIIKNSAAEYSDEIQLLVTNVSNAIDLIEASVPELVKSVFEEWFTEFKAVKDSILNIISDGEITSEELRECATQVEEKANKLYEKMMAVLPEDKKAKIEELKKGAEENLASEKEQVEREINQKIDEVKLELQRLKNGRKGK